MDDDVGAERTGSEYTDGLVHMQGHVGGGDGWGGPPKTYTVTLRLTSQSPYRDFGDRGWVSAVSGELARMADGYFIELIPISGFVNRASEVKLSYYSGARPWIGPLTVA